LAACAKLICVSGLQERITIAVTVTGSEGDTVLVAGGGAGHLKEAMEEIAYYGTRLLLRFADMPVDRSVVESAKALVDGVKGMMLNVEDVAAADDVAFLDAKGIETILNKPLRNGSLTIAAALGAVLVSDRADGLIPTVVVDEDLISLGLCYSNDQSVLEALKRCVGVYWSRTRGLWIKGLTSGATQELLRIDLDCDRDSMRFVVRQAGSGFCHMVCLRVSMHLHARISKSITLLNFVESGGMSHVSRFFGCVHVFVGV